jgi:hypothetical protein
LKKLIRENKKGKKRTQDIVRQANYRREEVMKEQA